MILSLQVNQQDNLMKYTMDEYNFMNKIIQGMTRDVSNSGRIMRFKCDGYIKKHIII